MENILVLRFFFIAEPIFAKGMNLKIHMFLRLVLRYNNTLCRGLIISANHGNTDGHTTGGKVWPGLRTMMERHIGSGGWERWCTAQRGQEPGKAISHPRSSERAKQQGALGGCHKG